jgi:hypothetical protein
MASAIVGGCGAAAPGVAKLALLSRASLLTLYKQILRSAETFPSSKRRGIIRDIKLDWRDGARLTDEATTHAAHTRAVDGLKMLQQYTTLKSANTHTWTLQLGGSGTKKA